jgi:hypothetical protein
MFNLHINIGPIETQIEADSSDTIQQVKRKIQKQHNIDVNKQDLYLGGQKLENERTLKSYNIGQKDHIKLNQINIPGSFEIIVKSMNGNKPITLQVQSSYTVEEVKRKYQEKTGVAVHKQKYLCWGKELKNLSLLSDYCIKESSNICLVIRVNGG